MKNIILSPKWICRFSELRFGLFMVNEELFLKTNDGSCIDVIDGTRMYQCEIEEMVQPIEILWEDTDDDVWGGE